MAETLTANYSWTKPDPGASANTWGATLNADLDKIDAQVFSNQQAGVQGSVPVGSGALWFTNTPPTNWLICDGSSLSTTGPYAALFAVLGTAFNQSGDPTGTFRLPRLIDVFPFGAGATVALAGTGGASSTPLSIAQLPSHAHSISDVAHNHGVNDPGHNHSQSPHGHGLNDPGHTHGGVVRQMSGWYSLAAQSPQISSGQQTDAAGTGISVQTSYANINASGAGIYLNASGTGLSTTNAVGSGSPVPTMPPFLGIVFIIKFQ